MLFVPFCGYIKYGPPNFANIDDYKAFDNAHVGTDKGVPFKTGPGFGTNELKIDKSFVSGPRRSEAILNMVIAMAKSLKLSTVAEGVETQYQLVVDLRRTRDRVGARVKLFAILFCQRPSGAE